jgi:hypothetical protein
MVVLWIGPCGMRMIIIALPNREIYFPARIQDGEYEHNLSEKGP